MPDAAAHRPLRLGTRGSLLATTQSGWVADRIRAATGRDVELVHVKTVGDQEQDRPLSEIGGQGLFTRELDRALLDDLVDLAVHSLKDLPTSFAEGLTLAAVPEREDPRDVLIAPSGGPSTLAELPEGASLGTSSLRRQALALAFRPDLEVLPIRGNLDTRIAQVDDGRFHATLLAAAGVRRLGWGERISEFMDSGAWLPAPGQGALAVVVRTERLVDHAAWIQALDHSPTRSAVAAERAILHTLQAGCQLPVGALGLAYGGGLRLRALVASPDGRRLVRADATGAIEDAVALGARVAKMLIDRGADDILANLDIPDAVRSVSSPGSLSN